MSMYVNTRYDKFMATVTVTCDSIDQIDLKDKGFRIDFTDQLEAADQAANISRMNSEKVSYEQEAYSPLEKYYIDPATGEPTDKTNAEVISELNEIIVTNEKIIQDVRRSKTMTPTQKEIAIQNATDAIAAAQAQLDPMYPFMTNLQVIDKLKAELSELVSQMRNATEEQRKALEARYKELKAKIDELEKPIKDLEYGTPEDCSLCKGEKVVCMYCAGTGKNPDTGEACYYCGGMGRAHDHDSAMECPECHGTGIDEENHKPGIQDLITQTCQPFLSITNENSDVFCNADDETLIRNGMQYWINEDKKSMTFRFIPQLNSTSCARCEGTGDHEGDSFIKHTNCKTCNGEGYVIAGYSYYKQPCSFCNQGVKSVDETKRALYSFGGCYSYDETKGFYWDSQDEADAVEYDSEDEANAAVEELGLTGLVTIYSKYHADLNITKYQVFCNSGWYIKTDSGEYQFGAYEGIANTISYDGDEAAYADAEKLGLTDIIEIRNKPILCNHCNGRTYVQATRVEKQRCSDCNGTGKGEDELVEDKCKACQGTGETPRLALFQSLICVVAFDYNNATRFEVCMLPRLMTGDIEKAPIGTEPDVTPGVKVEDPVLGLGTWTTTEYDYSAKEDIIISHPLPDEEVRDGMGELPRPDYEFNSPLDKDHLYVNNTEGTKSPKVPLYICKSSAYISDDLIDRGYEFDWSKFKSDLYDIGAQTALDIPWTINGQTTTANLEPLTAEITLVPTYMGDDEELKEANKLNVCCYEIVQSISSEKNTPVYSKNQLRIVLAV